MVFALARRLKLSENAALAAGVMLLTGIQSFNNGRKCMVDSMLAFFVLLTIYAFHSLVDERDRRKKAAFFLLYSAGLAGGFMTKGLIGFAFPWAGLGMWLVADDLFFAGRFGFRRYLLLALGVVPALVPILGWLYRLYLAGGWGPIHTVLIVNGFGRFTGAQGDHIKPAWFYLSKLFELFQPWLVVFLAALVYAVILIRKRKLGRETLPLLCESIVPFILLSCASSKRHVYLLPIYSAWALLAAWFMIDRREVWMAWTKRLPSAIVRYRLWFPAVAAAAGMTVCCFLAAGWAKTIPAAALLMLAGAIVWRRGRAVMALLTLALCVVCFEAVILARGNRKESLRPLFAECRRLEQEGNLIRLASSTSERTQGAAVFYMKKRMREVERGVPMEPHEKRVVRSKAPIAGKRFADHHYIIGND